MELTFDPLPSLNNTQYLVIREQKTTPTLQFGNIFENELKGGSQSEVIQF
jgi:hypothetical protein